MINESTIKFLKALGNTTIALRTFPDKSKKLKGVKKEGNRIRCNCCGGYYPEKQMYLGIKNRPICKKCSTVKINIKLEDLRKFENLLWFKNNNNQGVHVAVNGAHSDKEVTKIYAQFFEIDDRPLSEQMALVKRLKIRPSMVVKTRKSLHVYFLLKDGQDIHRFKEIQQRLAHTYGGDMQKSNLSTCMRIPGFYHRKKEPVMVELLEYHPELRYTQDEIVNGLSLCKYTPPEPKHTYKKGINCDRSEITNMVYSHVRDEVCYETDEKIIMNCLVHDDSSPSAVFFKQSLFYYCSGCGAKMNIKELAESQGWKDVLHQLNVF